MPEEHEIPEQPQTGEASAEPQTPDMEVHHSLILIRFLFGMGESGAYRQLAVIYDGSSIYF